MLLTWTPPGVDPAVGTVFLPEPLGLTWEDCVSRVKGGVMRFVLTAP